MHNLKSFLEKRRLKLALSRRCHVEAQRKLISYFVEVLYESPLARDAMLAFAADDYNPSRINGMNGLQFVYGKNAKASYSHFTNSIELSFFDVNDWMLGARDELLVIFLHEIGAYADCRMTRGAQDMKQSERNARAGAFACRVACELPQAHQDRILEYENKQGAPIRYEHFLGEYANANTPGSKIDFALNEKKLEKLLAPLDQFFCDHPSREPDSNAGNAIPMPGIFQPMRSQSGQLFIPVWCTEHQSVSMLDAQEHERRMRMIETIDMLKYNARN